MRNSNEAMGVEPPEQSEAGLLAVVVHDADQSELGRGKSL
jgi:hypothetical protein